MIQVQVRQKSPYFLFAGIVAVIYTVAMTLVSRLANIESSDIVSIGITFDIVVMVPLAYYLLIIRRGGLSIVRVAPVVLLSLLFASLVLPSDQQRTLHVLETILVPVELCLLGWIIWRTARALSNAGRNMAVDPLEQFRLAAFDLFKNNQIAGVFASEIAVFYYFFGSWRSRPHCSVGAKAFTHHRRSGQGGLVFAFLLLMAGEGFAVHLLLANWSSLAAWLFSISTLYGAVWLVADFRATILRPILVSEENIQIRAGIRYTLTVPRTQISEISSNQPDFGKESLNLKLMGSPTHWLIFSELVVAQGPYGTRRNVRAVGLEPDDRVEFERALA